MKKTAILLIGLTLITSCYNNKDLLTDSTGFLSIDLQVSMTINEEGGRIQSLDTDDFMVVIFTVNHVEVIQFKGNELPSSIELPVGSYYIYAHSDNLVPAAFEAAYYSGKSEIFSIKMEETRQVTVVCTLANCMLSISYSANVQEKFTNYYAEVGYPGGMLSIGGNESQIAYFDIMPLSITAHLEYMEGEMIKTKTVTGNIPNPSQKVHYKVHIDAALSNGQVGISFSVDEDVEIVELFFGETPETPIPVIEIEEVEYGYLLITEIMYDPDALSDNLGEWVELYNASNKMINLNGLKFTDNGSNFTINQDHILNPGSYYTIAKNEAALLNPDFVTNTLALNNTGELLKLSTPTGLEIAVVDYTLILQQMSNPAGASLNLSRNKFNADDAQLPQNWCSSTEVYSTGDKGTPGRENKMCQ